jgi:hypothetical protein
MAHAEGTKVVDKTKTSVWVVNLGQFRFPHGTREGVFFDPRIAVKIEMDDWIKSQEPLLAEVDDPHTDDLPASPVIDPNPLVDLDTGKPITGVGTGPAGTGTADELRAAAAAAEAEAKAKAEAAKPSKAHK